eukprot:TRINITY_DN4551_c0_g4_i3.p1 TRINITY_DN4551_c0_g4~~TRINITY_DN4551_c0_g4_i3.p1  ORF type:complete len:190 (+),score=30.54 TRINITY_DN4551_c0_g4_i3:611-1180(+)
MQSFSFGILRFVNRRIFLKLKKINRNTMKQSSWRLNLALFSRFVDRLKKDNISYELSRRYFTGKTKYPPIVIFPEGTTSNGKALIQFRKGAFLGGVPVTPIILKYSFSTTNPSDVCTNLGPHVIRMILEPSNHLEVTFLPTYYPSEQEREDPILYTANVRSEMARIGKLPLYDVDYQHKLTYNKLVNFK